MTIPSIRVPAGYRLAEGEIATHLLIGEGVFEVGWHTPDTDDPVVEAFLWYGNRSVQVDIPFLYHVGAKWLVRKTRQELDMEKQSRKMYGYEKGQNKWV